MRDLSIVIPAYNEALRIEETLESIATFLDARDLDDEVIVVDDGSADNTVEVVEALTPLFRRLKVIRGPRNLGKGNAVRRGMLVATGRHRMFLDADNSTNISEYSRLMAAGAAEPVEPAVIIASVAKAGATVSVQQPGVRSLMGRLGNKIIQWLVLPGIEDSQRGFKIFTGEATDAIFRRCQTNGWAFDVEVLALARAHGYHVLEVPVTWEHREDSRVRPGAYLTSLWDVGRISVRVRNERRELERLT